MLDVGEWTRSPLARSLHVFHHWVAHPGRTDESRCPAGLAPDGRYGFLPWSLKPLDAAYRAIVIESNTDCPIVIFGEVPPPHPRRHGGQSIAQAFFDGFDSERIALIVRRFR